MSLYLYKFRKFLLHNILHADDSPRSIALGVAIAMFVAFLPLVGFQTAIAVGIATVFRANRAVCIPIVWITNPLTIAPIYGACLALGRFIRSAPGGDAAALVSLQHGHEAASLLELAFWKHLFCGLAGFGLDLWTGCVIVGAVLAGVSYILAQRGVEAYRTRRQLKILARKARRSRFQHSKRIIPGKAG